MTDSLDNEWNTGEYNKKIRFAIKLVQILVC